jgi:hypothetical protein
MSRFAFGPKIGPVKLVAPTAGPTPTAPAAPGSPLPDLALTFAGVDSEGNFSFGVPAFVVGQVNAPVAVHVALFENGPDGVTPLSPLPADAATALQQAAAATPDPLAFSASFPASPAGAPLVVDATEAPEGDYTALAILEFVS